MIPGPWPLVRHCRRVSHTLHLRNPRPSASPPKGLKDWRRDGYYIINGSLRNSSSSIVRAPRPNRGKMELWWWWKRWVTEPRDRGWRHMVRKIHVTGTYGNSPLAVTHLTTCLAIDLFIGWKTPYSLSFIYFLYYWCTKDRIARKEIWWITN